MTGRVFPRTMEKHTAAVMVFFVYLLFLFRFMMMSPFLIKVCVQGSFLYEPVK